MPQKVREVKRALKKKGFHEEERDHWYYFFYFNGKKTDIYTKISHGETEIATPFCSAMARQLRLNGSQFENFVDCDLTSEKYLKHLTDAKHLQVSEDKRKKDGSRAKPPRRK